MDFLKTFYDKTNAQKTELAKSNKGIYANEENRS